MAPERAAVERLMKRCQIGDEPRRWERAHDIMARVLRHPGPAADSKSNGCARAAGRPRLPNLPQCFDAQWRVHERAADGLTEAATSDKDRFQYWEAAMDPTPF